MITLVAMMIFKLMSKMAIGPTNLAMKMTNIQIKMVIMIFKVMTTTLTINPVNHDIDNEDKGGEHYGQYDSQGSYQQAGYRP